MAKARVAMHSIEEVLRLHHECGRSQREIARSCGLSTGAVNKLLRLAGQAGVAWPLPADLGAAQLQERLYGRPAGSRRSRQLEGIDFAAVHKALQARKHLTLQRVWQEYREQQPEGYSLQPVLRAVSAVEVSPEPGHAAGAQGRREAVRRLCRPDGSDRRCGERRVARGSDLRGSARREFVFFTRRRVGGQDVESWVNSHVRALEYFGGGRSCAGARQPEVGA